MLQTANLTIGYNQRVVLRDLNLSLQAGQLICLLGANGCGKSTLLRTLSHLQPAISGNIRLNNTDSTTADWSRQVALVLTDRPQLEHTTVRDVVALGRHPYSSFLGGLNQEDNEIIDKVLQRVFHHPEDYIERQFMQLSDGEKQRVLIAKALAQDTPVILLDEPTSFLDIAGRMQIFSLLRQLATEEQKAILLSTHEIDLALQSADQIWLVHEQQIVVGSPDQLIQANRIQEAFQGEGYWFNPKTRSFFLN